MSAILHVATFYSYFKSQFKCPASVKWSLIAGSWLLWGTRAFRAAVFTLAFATFWRLCLCPSLTCNFRLQPLFLLP